MSTANLPAIRASRPAWNKGRIAGQKLPLQQKHVWAIRVRLEIAQRTRELALFNLAIDSKLRGCDLVRLKVADVNATGRVKQRAAIVQNKTSRPVSFEITEGTRTVIEAWLGAPLMVGSEHLWPGQFHERQHISTRQYARLVRDWVASIGLEPSAYGTIPSVAPRLRRFTGRLAVNRHAILTPYRHPKMTPLGRTVAGPMRCSPHTAQPYRASVGVGHSRVLKRQLSLPVSTMSQ